MTDFESYLAAATAPDSKQSPGVNLLAVNEKGERIYDKSAGYIDRGTDHAKVITHDGVMWLASCTKLLTSIAALQAVERGLITLDEPVDRVVPELAAPQVIKMDDSAADGYTLTPAKNKITLRHLLTHTAGFAYDWVDRRLGAWRAKNPGPPVAEGTVSTSYNFPLVFEPGEGWVYGVSLDWAGEIVARLNKTTLADYFEENIYKPLNITGLTFRLWERPELKEKLIWAEVRLPDGGLKQMDTMLFPERVGDNYGGGGLWGSGEEYFKVIADVVSKDPKTLKRETITGLMTAPQLTNEAALKALLSARGAISANAANIDLSEAGINHGLAGLLITKDSPTMPKGTLTWGGMPNIKWFVNAEIGIGAGFFTQVWPVHDPQSVEFSSEFFKEVVRLATANK